MSTQTKQRSVAQRAAHYFGVEDEPRTSIKVGPKECLIVLKREPAGRVLAYYDENRRDMRGHYVWLTEKQRVALLEALSDA